MWNSYFYMWQKKYNMKVSTKKPLVLRFDGKDITKNKEINLMYDFKGSFLNTLKKTAIYFTQKYNCYAIHGADEISFIFPEPMLLVKDLDPSDESTHSNEIIALFSQNLFSYFNIHFDGENIFWHGKCFSIPEEKLISYLKFRSGIIRNVMATYFLKSYNIPRIPNEKLNKIIKKCCSLKEYNPKGQIENGFLYYNGDLIDLFEFEKGNIKIIENNNFNLSQTDIDNFEICLDDDKNK